MSEAPLRIGVAGIGTVGAGLLRLLSEPPPRVLGRPIEVAAVSARSRSRKREIDISRFRWVDDPIEIAEDCSIDVLVELIGGSDGPAKRAVEAALARGAHVVTANKALLAEHGAELAALSEAKGGRILFEAAVAGGVPIVKALKESLAANRIRSVSGILNGTCNYLLTEMEASGRAYEDVLADAQRLGYAEADPTMDVGGYDAAHKISLLAAIAFGAAPDYGAVEIEGVDRITLRDIRLAGKLGYRIKLLAKAERLGVGVRVHVHPALLPMDHPLAGVSGALNAVVVDADPVGRLTFTGRGAGGGPTASAVAADLYELANGGGGPAFGQPVAALKTFATERKDSAADSRWFLRLLVQDRPGVIAAVSDRLGREGVSIESFLQQPNADEAAVPIVLTTRPCRRAALDAAVEAISSLDIVTEAVRTIAIDDGQA